MSGPADGSSHKTFRKIGKMPIKLAYVELVRDVVESEVKSEKDD